ncbi:MAG: YHS domain-containing protein [Deltaproteobacteria bacterium]|nr:YHS domain-containing protein [Deltaproteobacteria bacterium]
MDFDPVCGKRVDATQSSPNSEYKKKRYFFCSERCKQAFEREAERMRLHELAKVGALLSKGRVRWGLA